MRGKRGSFLLHLIQGDVLKRKIEEAVNWKSDFAEIFQARSAACPTRTLTFLTLPLPAPMDVPPMEALAFLLAPLSKK